MKKGTEKLTKEKIAELADHIYKLFKENDMWSDTSIYFNGKRLSNRGPDGRHHYDGSAYEEENKDPNDYFEYVNSDHILSMSFEGPVYDMLNYDGYPSVQKQFDELLAQYGLYYELGNAWNLSCYYI